MPFAAYGAVLSAAVLLPGHAGPALFVIAASTLLLLLDGIHNAWDTVTYMAIQQSRKSEARLRREGT